MKFNKSMPDQSKMLQILIDGQKDIKEELTLIKGEIKGVEKNLSKRINKLGLQIADLEDDAPTVEEFEKLEKRVTKVENKLQI